VEGVQVAEVFGNRADFAIEAGVEPHLMPPSAVWGHMCVWCRGVALGDLSDLHCALYPAYCSFRWLPGHLDDLWADEFIGLGAVAAWNFLDGLLYGYHGDVEVPDDRTVEECQADSLRWSRHNFLTNWGEQFDCCKAFVLSPPGGSVRILYRRRREAVQMAEVSRSGLVAASAGFVQWFETQELRLRGPDTKPGAVADRSSTMG
jgi:hypothetical protein